MTEPIAL